jgi:cytidylate kinase
MKEQIHEDPKIIAAAEKQMQAWSISSSAANGGIRQEELQKSSGRLLRYLTISRETGAGGSTIAKIVGQKLGWDVLDKELLDRITQRYHGDRDMLDLVDETPSNWIIDVLGTWMDNAVISHETYLVQLTRIIQAAAKRGKVVFVGRGAQFLLPREQGFSVRLVAPEQFRIENLTRIKGIKETEAKHLLQETDRDRLEFGRRFFSHDVSDPHLYDLIVNTERLGMEGAAELILAAISSRLSGQAK